MFVMPESGGDAQFGSWASSLLVGASLGRIFFGSALTAAHFTQGRDGKIPHGWSLIPTSPL